MYRRESPAIPVWRPESPHYKGRRARALIEPVNPSHSRRQGGCRRGLVKPAYAFVRPSGICCLQWSPGPRSRRHAVIDTASRLRFLFTD
ncbi:hypothetical protein PATSB16_08290 [Pandoraea thiooxydans]|nr:hypothetical protein PATSB16_08290 [Pandoraea thiooxydans]